MPQAPTKQRIALWDNARFVLIAIVVVGHLLTTVRTDSNLGFALYAGIFLFHMPAMILLAGLFSKPETSPKAVRSTVQLAVVWLIWEAIWAIIRGIGGTPPGEGFLINPSWTLWFLVSLVTMRILLPYIAMLRHPLLFSIVIALVSGLSPQIGTEFSISRTLSLLPFFVLGWLIRDRGWLDGEWFTKPRRSTVALGWATFAVMLLAFMIPADFKGWWRIDWWLTWRYDLAAAFERGPVGGWVPETFAGVAFGGIGITLVLLSIAAAITFALLLVVPRQRTFYTKWGSRTLYVYLLHGPIVQLLRGTGVIDAIGLWGIWGIAVLIALGCVIAGVLSITWVTRLTRPIIEPKIDWMMRRTRSAAAE